MQGTRQTLYTQGNTFDRLVGFAFGDIYFQKHAVWA